MSAPQAFPDLPAALAAYAAGHCRRWVRVDGWQIDLVKAQAEAGRVREEPAAIGVSADEAVMALVGRPAWDRMVADSVGRELARAVNIAAELSQAVEVLPELAVPSDPPPDASAYRCPWCSRPWDGVK